MAGGALRLSRHFSLRPGFKTLSSLLNLGLLSTKYQVLTAAFLPSPPPSAATAVSTAVVTLLISLLVCLPVHLLVVVLITVAVVSAISMPVIAVMRRTVAVAGRTVIAPVVEAVLISKLP